MATCMDKDIATVWHSDAVSLDAYSPGLTFAHVSERPSVYMFRVFYDHVHFVLSFRHLRDATAASPPHK